MLNKLSQQTAQSVLADLEKIDPAAVRANGFILNSFRNLRNLLHTQNSFGHASTNEEGIYDSACNSLREIHGNLVNLPAREQQIIQGFINSTANKLSFRLTKNDKSKERGNLKGNGNGHPSTVPKINSVEAQTVNAFTSSQASKPSSLGVNGAPHNILKNESDTKPGIKFAPEHVDISSVWNDQRNEKIASEAGNLFPVPLSILQSSATIDIKTLLAQGKRRQQNSVNKHSPISAPAAQENNTVMPKATHKVETALLPEEIALARTCGLEISGDPVIEKAWKQILQYALTQTTMMIRGETGTGKEPFSKAVHAIRKLRNPHTKEFVMVNASAITHDLFESEFFGHLKGSFTGAFENRVGKFKAAHEGTLFIDEVGDLPMNQQAKLLRVLEDGMVTPVGGNKAEHVDVKVVCATNKPLEQMVQMGTFREDLLRRLEKYTVFLPQWEVRTPEHREKVITFLLPAIAATRTDLNQTLSINEEAMELLLGKLFKGNVREVHSLIERAFVQVCENFEKNSHVTLTKEDISDAVQDVTKNVLARSRTVNVAIDLEIPLPAVVAQATKEIEKRYIQRALKKTHGNVGRCAKLCGFSRRSITAKLAEYNLDKNQYK